MDNDFFGNAFGGIFYGLGPADFAFPFGFLLWSLVFLVSLNGINLHNWAAFGGYTLFHTATGVTLCIAVQQEFLGGWGFRYSTAAVFVFAGVSASIWSYRRRREIFVEKARQREAHMAQLTAATIETNTGNQSRRVPPRMAR